jgi:ribosome-binding factor A
MTLRQEKVREELKHLAATFTEMEANRTSLITVTDCKVSEDLKYATVYLTVMPTDKEEDTLNFLKRKRSELRDYVKSKMRIHTIPFFEIEIDMGEKHRQKIDELLREDTK